MIAILLVCLITLLLWAAFIYYRRSQSGPAALGTILYDDAGRHRPAKALVSHRYRLAGKPDYIVRNGSAAFPLEVKSRHCGKSGPYESEKAQLYAECLLVEETTGQAVDYGVLGYSNRRFQIAFGDRERRYILTLLDEIWLARGERDIARNHNDAFRCRGCGYRSREVCGQALNQ